MKVQLKWAWLVVLSCALILVACSDQEEGTPANEENDQQQEATNDAASGTQTEEEGTWPYTYVDARGKEITLTEKPERIAAVTWMITENLLALERPPIAADTVEVMSGWASMGSYFEKYDIHDLGTPTEVNYEELLSMKPDLILATTANEDVYEKLEKIAPVIVFDSDALFNDWTAAITEVGKAINEESIAQAYIDELMVTIEDGRQTIQEKDLGTFGFIRILNKDMYTFNRGQLAVYYDAEKGLGLPIPANWPEETGAVQLEALPDINPDYMFISSGEGPENYKQLQESAVWGSLTAVKNNQVYDIDLSGLTGGPLAIRYGVETILSAVK